MTRILFRLVLSFFMAAPLLAQADSRHAHGVDQRGDHAMGFSHEKTTHHFYLRPDGGVISVSANDPSDTDSVSKIRHHLRMISQLFPRGDFSMPAFIHDQTPPGVEVMKRLADQIAYRWVETASGAEVRISSRSKEAVEAVHDFLRFQITDHRTGDSLEVQP